MTLAVDQGPAAPWVRIFSVALGLPNLAAGLWAVIAPESWYDSFPGFDPRVVAAEPPFNAHLATDAGAGLLASGAVLLVAAWLGDRRSVALGTVAFAFFAVPHAAYHVLNPAPGLEAAEDVGSALILVFAAGVVVVLLAATVRRSASSVDADHRENEEP